MDQYTDYPGLGEQGCASLDERDHAALAVASGLKSRSQKPFGSAKPFEAMRLRLVSTNQGKLDFLKIVLEPAIALGVVESVEQLAFILTAFKMNL